jgi:hypothetical protein
VHSEQRRPSVPPPYHRRRRPARTPAQAPRCVVLVTRDHEGRIGPGEARQRPDPRHLPGRSVSTGASCAAAVSPPTCRSPRHSRCVIACLRSS